MSRTATGSTNQALNRTSFLYGANAAFVEQLYERFLHDPQSVDAQWRAFFQAMGDTSEGVAAETRGASWQRADWPPDIAADVRAPPAPASDAPPPAAEAPAAAKAPAAAEAPAAAVSQAQVRAATQDSVRALMMIRAYRIRGHLVADLDPLKLESKPQHPELQPQRYGFTDADLDRPIFIDNVLGLETATVRQMLDILKRTYCGTLAVEFMHISDPEQKMWIQERIEGPDKEIYFTPEGKKAILQRLIEAEGIEKFLHVKYTGTKRFGLDGAEALIPALEQILKRGSHLGVRQIVMGMPHRGRLNVLSNIMHKPFAAIFHEFGGGSSNPDDVEGSGDVKYHLGTSSDREFDGNTIHLSLTANPSHLESVDPVVLGKARAKQDQLGDLDRSSVMPLLMHGDAAFAGQGVVAECFGLSGLKGHRSGGAVHVIVNNQIGFTTAPHHGRSSPYPSDVAKVVQAPIFHANGDDPEAVVQATRIATEFRQKFCKPVVVDMFCYRRFGHNEGDDPMFTQPLMYGAIKEHPTVLEIYAGKLIAEGLVTRAHVDQAIADFRALLEREFKTVGSWRPNKADWLDGEWTGLKQVADHPAAVHTGVAAARLRRIGQRLTAIPETFNAHRTIRRFMARRGRMFQTGQGIDWATAEALAWATLLEDNFPVRLSGQDCERGTFSQRHSVLIDQDTEERFVPLNSIAPAQAAFEVVNSMLSEMAVLGFEYGYSLSEPNALVLWEAQFGDFANGAQVIIDQFIASGVRKWLRMSGLVMLLPHGYEGQGPEHSSARLERFLQLCAEDNVQVANCTTPANYFHILRRQLHREFRVPLIVMTPKSLLRHKACVSALDDMAEGTAFHRLLWDGAESLPGQGVTLRPPEAIRRVILCSGKVYYDLYAEREKRGIDDIYLLRVEQLYPFPARAMIKELARFPRAGVIWCQEEPKNMGAWSFMEPNVTWALEYLKEQHGGQARRVGCVARPAAASPATGVMSRHLKQLQVLLEDALAA